MFVYSDFLVSRYAIEDHIKSIKRGCGSEHFARRVIASMIEAIADNDCKFDVKDAAMCQLLEEMVRDGGCGTDGVYTEAAHKAMRNLCIWQGKNPDEHLLYNKNIRGLFDKAKSKIKGLFGFGKNKQPVVETAEKVSPVKTGGSADAPSRKKGGLYAMAVTITGVVAAGAVMLMGPAKSTPDADMGAKPVPTFKKVSVADTSYNMNRVYNIGQNSLKKRNAAANKVAPQVATDSLSVQLSKTSKSALDVILGVKQANELCRRVRHQIDAGIFTVPNGMSVERVAHAMLMSHIYEGNSIILRALKSALKLTPAQQVEFNRHVAEIGDMGLGLQRRMAAKQKLSKHSYYDCTSAQLQKVHVKNLKQLKQLQKAVRTR